MTVTSLTRADRLPEGQEVLVPVQVLLGQRGNVLDLVENEYESLGLGRFHHSFIEALGYLCRCHALRARMTQTAGQFGH